MINEEENFAATHPQEQEILRDEILAAVGPLSAAAAGPSSAIGPPSAVAAAPDASIGHSCSAVAKQTISKAALGKLNYLRACLVRQLYFHATYPHLFVGLKWRFGFSHFCENNFLQQFACRSMRSLSIFSQQSRQKFWLKLTKVYFSLGFLGKKAWDFPENICLP
jgi:hypothetical protein